MTTIQISRELQNKLNEKKIFERETYEEVIWDLLEDSMELSEQTKKDIEEYEKEMKKNGYANFKSLAQIKKESGL